ncbi:hypothetical protein [Limosilactobacillus equigenerosi]|uniref:hypothetical protein n=1 Tax=Limosilactobacillus equigenerosi TaxID=417373 RepID=UPI0006CFC3A7|nr:hypothetical protein [Limosilactobacillus equigenerosi]
MFSKRFRKAKKSTFNYKNGDKFKFDFINFNYTMLLDNYMFLDLEQFNPHPYINGESNLDIADNINGYLYNYRNLIHHVNGNQYIRDSMVFGYTLQDYQYSEKKGKNVVMHKPFLGNYDVLYEDMIKKCELYYNIWNVIW